MTGRKNIVIFYCITPCKWHSHHQSHEKRDTVNGRIRKPMPSSTDSQSADLYRRRETEGVLLAPHWFWSRSASASPLFSILDSYFLFSLSFLRCFFFFSRSFFSTSQSISLFSPSEYCPFPNNSIVKNNWNGKTLGFLLCIPHQSTTALAPQESNLWWMWIRILPKPTSDDTGTLLPKEKNCSGIMTSPLLY